MTKLTLDAVAAQWRELLDMIGSRPDAALPRQEQVGQA